MNDTIVMMNELPFDAYSSLVEIFGEGTINLFRQKYKDNCYGLADNIKFIMNSNNILAEIVTFKNGNAFLDGGIKLGSDIIYTHHTVVLMGEWVIDLLHTDEIIKTKDYITKLMTLNPKLRIDYTMSTYWYTDDGYPCKFSIDSLMNYKY